MITSKKLQNFETLVSLPFSTDFTTKSVIKKRIAFIANLN